MAVVGRCSRRDSLRRDRFVPQRERHLDGRDVGPRPTSVCCAASVVGHGPALIDEGRLRCCSPGEPER